MFDWIGRRFLVRPSCDGNGFQTIIGSRCTRFMCRRLVFGQHSMRPKQKSAKGKGGKKGTIRVHDVEHQEEENAEIQLEQPEQDQDEPDIDDEEEDDSPTLQRIVEFYEARSYFYNLRHEKYRNTKLKEAELAELAKEIKWPVEKIKRRFKNLRSAYGKIKNRAGSAGKSGQASSRLTMRQEWKLRNLAFLDEVIQPRTQGHEVGRVTGEEEIEEDNGDGDELREDFVAPDNVDGLYQKRGRSANSQDCAFNKTGTSTSKKRKGTSSTPGVAEVLTEMLLENRNRDREMERKLEESATRQPDEREAWGNWLQTVVRNCPKEKFRQFQTETLALSQRYLPTDEGQSQQCPGPSTMFSPQPAASHFQAHGQFQHPSLQFQGQPHVYYQQQQMQEPGYMRRPTFTQLQPTQQHQQQQQPQHQPTRPTSAPTPVGTSNIIASSYQIANTNDGDQDLTPPLRAPSSGERLSLPGFNVGSFGIHGANRDQPESDAD